MPYTPPSGFVETLPSPEDRADRRKFHTDPGCPRIHDRDRLHEAVRPGSASRCPACAEAQ